MDIEIVKAAKEAYQATKAFMYDTWGVRDTTGFYGVTSNDGELRHLVQPQDPVELVIFNAISDTQNELSKRIHDAEELLRKSASTGDSLTRNIISLTALRSEIEKRSKKVD